MAQTISTQEQQEETFFTSVGCMDGRVQEAIAKFGEEKFHTHYPDTVTEAGLVGKLCHKEKALLDAIKFKVCDVSIGKHHAKGVIVHGHAECAGNPVEDDQQIKDIRDSVAVMKALAGETPVVGVFVHRDPSNPTHWIAEEV